VLARLARVLVAVALLAGWQAALQHPIEHLDPFHEAGSLCDELAALTACAAGGQPSTSAPWSDYGVPVCPVLTPRRAEAPPFLSQGPPIARV
jgi:hypothetical protein